MFFPSTRIPQSDELDECALVVILRYNDYCRLIAPPKDGSGDDLPFFDIARGRSKLDSQILPRGFRPHCFSNLLPLGKLGFVTFSEPQIPEGNDPKYLKCKSGCALMPEISAKGLYLTVTCFF